MTFQPQVLFRFKVLMLLLFWPQKTKKKFNPCIGQSITSIRFVILFSWCNMSYICEYCFWLCDFYQGCNFLRFHVASLIANKRLHIILVNFIILNIEYIWFILDRHRYSNRYMYLAISSCFRIFSLAINKIKRLKKPQSVYVCMYVRKDN